jgi:F0F1-type ATP synthase epsilon subunit
VSERYDPRTSVWLRIMTAERIRLETAAHWVQVPTPQGLLGVWPQHARLIGAVVPGDIEYETRDGIQREFTEGGLLHIRHGQVLILTGSRAAPPVPSEVGTTAWEESVEEIEAVLGDLEMAEAEPEPLKNQAS